MTIHKRRPSEGFTLIEALLYIAMMSIMIGGSVVGAYNLLEGSRRLNTHIATEEEAHFLLRKIAWTITNTSAVNTPAPGESGPTLSVERIDDEAPLTVSLVSSTVYLAEGNGDPLPLNNESVAVSQLTFEHIPAVGGRPAAVKATITVNNRPFTLLRSIR